MQICAVAGEERTHPYGAHHRHVEDGRKLNGSLLYTLLPVEQALAQHNQHQLHLAEMATERHRAQQKLAAQDDMMRGGEVV